MENKVKWIKLDIDMFSNPKIKKIRRLPDGNNVLLLWIMLLTMAGKCNAGGMIHITENVLYTPEDLADELDLPLDTVRMGLQSLEKLKMIILEDGIEIKNWSYYQNVDGLEKIREQTRKRVNEHRERKKLECNVTSNVTVTDSSYSISNSNISYSYSNNSNLSNLDKLLEEYKDREYILNNQRLYNSIHDWLEYKDEKKQKSKHHYGKRGLTSLLNEFVKRATDFGIDSVEEVVNRTMSNNYDGLGWYWLDNKKDSKPQQQVQQDRQNDLLKQLAEA